ncbi:VOC family protein [Nakamurella sp. A5-74]|uniref:VOC family protein n=1 Tax=Nakamurella sp. A5-74 TaxID=3158264 RepID=A0AAU8DP55_9ACTN
MTARLRALAFDSVNPERPATFWARLLDRLVVRDAGALLLPGALDQVTLRFVAAETVEVGQNPLHLHLTGDDVPLQDTVVSALGLGATELDLGNPPDADFVVLADPDGNEFCVLEGGNSWVADCGFLGEVACDGSRAVGVFWSAALGWPLVWDSGAETAVQSPNGGTKISWGGEEAPTEPRVSRQRFELVTPQAELVAEVTRLEVLGATVMGTPVGRTHRLADPDGNEFTVSPG